MIKQVSFVLMLVIAIPGWAVEPDEITMYDSIYGSYRHFQRMIQDERYKLIDYPVLKKSQFFDLETDPLEMNDLINDPAQAERIAALRVSLKEWQIINGDPLDYNKPEASYAEYGGLGARSH